MKERGILFSGPMVRALLDGRKTQTRRVVQFREFGRSSTRGYDWTFRDRRMLWNDLQHSELIARSPYGVPGDPLWVRESGSISVSKDAFMYADSGGKIAPTAPAGSENWCREWKSCPSIHMPRWASRITMTLAAVRVERVEEISEADAVAEGIVEYPQGPLMHRYGLPEWDADERCATAREAFLKLFYGINERAPAGANPWVWVLTLKDIAVHGKAVAA